MSTSGTRHIFAGYGLGVAARFTRLDEIENLNHVAPAQGSAVLAPTGGRSEARVDKRWDFSVQEPRPRCLLAVDRVNTWVEGRTVDGRQETEVTVEVDGMEAVEQLHVDALRLHILAVHAEPGREATVTTRGNQILGLQMGKVKARIELDDERMAHTGSQQRLADFWRNCSEDYRQLHRSRFHTTEDGRALADDYGQHRFSLVREIELIGEEKDRADIWVEGGYTIRWKGFGRIILGEVHVKGHDRRVSLVRLAMGSNAGGNGTGGGGGSNGSTTGG